MEIVGHEIGRTVIGGDEFVFSVVRGRLLNMIDVIVDGVSDDPRYAGFIRRKPVIMPDLWGGGDMASSFPLNNQDQTFALRDDDLVSALVGTCMTDGRQEQVYVLNHSTGCGKETPDAPERLLGGFKLLHLPSRLMALLVAALILVPVCLSLRFLPLWLALPAFWGIKRHGKRPLLETLHRFTQEMVQKIINGPPPQEARPPGFPDIQSIAAGPFCG